MTTRKIAGTLEHALARACGALGGFAAAEEMLGVKSTTLAHAANPNKPDGVRLDLALRLDFECSAAGGGTPVFDWYERQIDQAPGPGLTPHEHLTRLLKSSSAAQLRLVEALADSGLDARERDQVTADLNQLSAAVDAMRRDLTGGG